MNKVIGTGKTIEQAIENGLKELNCSQSDVTIKVLNEGGFFKKAQVEIVRDVLEEEPVVEEIKAETLKVEESVVETKMPKVETEKVVEQNKTKVENKNNENTEAISSIKNFIEQLVKNSNAKEVNIDITNNETHYAVKVNGEALSGLIGSGGETLSAIETVLNVIVSKIPEQNKRVMLDIGNYKQSKIERLNELADKAANRVLETGEPYKFKPMNNIERKIIHTHLQGVEGIKTLSKGEEPNRFLTIYKEN